MPLPCQRQELTDDNYQPGGWLCAVPHLNFSAQREPLAALLSSCAHMHPQVCASYKRPHAIYSTQN